MTLLERREGRSVFLLVKRDVFEFSCSPEHAFTGGAIYGSKAEIFSDTPHLQDDGILIFSH